jgi:Fe-S-cluster containining protein
MRVSEEYDCQSCGACCSHKWSWPILRRDRSDAAGIPEEMVRRDYPLMKTSNNRCTALTGSVGLSVGCSIYADRPAACRAFVAGSALCLEARKGRGMLQRMRSNGQASKLET